MTFCLNFIKQNRELPVKPSISDVVKDGQRRGGVLATIRVYFDAEDLLETIFWKSARDKKRNRKRENTWKYYNDYP